MAFVTDHGIYCYTVMSFGLRNAGATYQRMMTKVFADQIGKNLEVYIDDMVDKTDDGTNLAKDVQEIFNQFRWHNLCLNPDKCAFSISEGKFLGFMPTQRGIEANLDKCEVVLSMKSPTTVNEV